MPKFKVRIDAVFIKEVEADSADDARDIANDEWTMDDYVETGEILVFNEDGGLADDEEEEEGLVEPVGPAPIPPPIEDVEQAECMNCGWNGGVDELGEIKGFHERVQPGDTAVPAGECPECGCLAYLKEDDFSDEEKADMKHNATMLDGCETDDELNAELRAQTQGN